MSDAIRDDLISLLHSQLPDRPADYFQLATELARHRLWLEYDRPRLLLMFAPPEASQATGSPDFIVQGPDDPMLLLFDAWFRGQTVKALYVEPCFGERSDLLATCDFFLRRCTATGQTLE